MPASFADRGMHSAADSVLRQPHRVGRPSPEQSKELMASVLRAAREEFAAKGFHLATMDAIAAKAGVSKRTLYAWHADKAALLHAAIVDRAAVLTDYVIDPKARLKDAITDYSQAVLSELSTDYSMSVGALIMWAARQFAPAGEALLQGQEFLHRPFVKFLQARGMTEGEAKSVARIYITALTSELMHRMIMGHAGPTSEQNRRQVATVAAMFLPGLDARLSQLSHDTKRAADESSH